MTRNTVFTTETLTFRTNPDTYVGELSYQGCRMIPYQTLVALFGPPNPGDGYKTDAEWTIQFSDGTTLCIYNWKNGPNYLGEDARLEWVDEWNVSGHGPYVLDYLDYIMETH